MLKQRKHSPFDDRSSPDGSHYISKYFVLCLLITRHSFFEYIDVKEDDDDDECSTDGSENSQKALVFAD
jgi:hypothetical protein